MHPLSHCPRGEGCRSVPLPLATDETRKKHGKSDRENLLPCFFRVPSVAKSNFGFRVSDFATGCWSAATSCCGTGHHVRSRLSILCGLCSASNLINEFVQVVFRIQLDMMTLKNSAN